MASVAKERYCDGMRCIFPLRPIAVATVLTTLGLTSALSIAQTRSIRDTATAYGARLNAKGQPANLNPARINSRIASRIDSRINLRIERYRPEATADPGTAFRSTMVDKTQKAQVIAPPQQQDIDDNGR